LDKGSLSSMVNLAVAAESEQAKTKTLPSPSNQYFIEALCRRQAK